MSGPSKKSSLSSSKPETLLVYVERLRQQAEEFQRTVDEELRTAHALLEDLQVRQAKRRGHGGLMDYGDFRRSAREIHLLRPSGRESISDSPDCRP